jgi:hypothetical protein
MPSSQVPAAVQEFLEDVVATAQKPGAVKTRKQRVVAKV